MSWTRRAAIRAPLVLACALVLISAPPAFAESPLDRAVRALSSRDALVDPAVAGFAREDRLAYAAKIASRAADGRRIVVAFVGVPDDRLDGFREQLYIRLRLDESMGTLVVATPTSITMHTPNLTPDAELAIIRADARALRVRAPRPYTKTLAEIVYDTGLVIHNTTEGARPRGSGAERNLSTFPGHFADESVGSVWERLVLPLAGVVIAAAMLVGATAFIVHRRTPPPG